MPQTDINNIGPKPFVASNPLPPLSEEDIVRFWSRVDKTPGQGPQGDCWRWTAGAFTGGYGSFNLKLESGKWVVLRATRIACFLQTGIDPHPDNAFHECHWPRCVRHVRPRTQEEICIATGMKTRKRVHYGPAPKPTADSFDPSSVIGREPYERLEDFTASMVERFWSRVDRQGPNDCWLWKLYTTKNGYGHWRVRKHNKSYLTHRLAWLFTNGTIPPGLVIRHNCPMQDNPTCCNPAHLLLGTQGQNIEDAMLRGKMARGKKHGTKTKPESVKRGDDRFNTKVPDAEVLRIHELRYQGWTLGDLGKEFPLRPAQLSRILSGKRRPELFYQFWSNKT